MTTGREEPPALATLTFHEGSRLEIEFAFGAGMLQVDPVVIHQSSAIDEAWQRAGRALRDLRLQVPGRGYDHGELRVALETLINAGRELGQRLTDENNSHWNKVQTAFRQARALTQKSFDWRSIPRVDVVAHTGFPVELLPVFPSTPPLDDVRNDSDLMRLAETLLGFNAVVRRIAPEANHRAMPMANEPTLPIQLFRFRTVDLDSTAVTEGAGAGFLREETFLQSLREVDVDGPWPMDESEQDVCERAIDVLFDSRQRLRTGAAAQGSVALSHFACHCYTTDEVSGIPWHSEQFKLLLSTQAGSARPITLGAIKSGYSKRGETQGPDEPPRAAVIFNACGASAIDPLSSLSFQKWFLSNGHPAFLGTHAAIPDDLAADFAEFFYTFLVGGFTIGEAVLLARRELLLAKRSPLGILYVLHGNDRLDVEVPRKDVLPQAFH